MKHVFALLLYDPSVLEAQPTCCSAGTDRWENEGGLMAAINSLPAPPGAMSTY
jgi:hypothetical protein